MRDARSSRDWSLGNLGARGRIARLGLVAGLLAALLVGCTRDPENALPGPSTPEAEPAPVPLATDLPSPHSFSVPRAQFHLEALARLTPRTPGSPTDQRARDYLERGFRAVGATVVDVSDREAPEALLASGAPRVDSENEIPTSARRPAPRHLVAEIAGHSQDVLLLVAAYPVVGDDAWIGDSGSALLLELARVLALEKPAYTVRLALAETRTDASRKAPIDAAQARSSVVAAGESLARSLAANGGLAPFRGVVVFDGIARPGLRIARDLRSHPVYRETFWASAGDLGFGQVFARDAGWASARSLHLGFRARGMDRVVAIVDEARARAELTPIRQDAGVSADSLAALGRVTGEALERLFHRLGRIDAFRNTGTDPDIPRQASPQIPEIPPSS